MIKGQYIFYSNGQEIGRSDNLITKFGKRFLTSHLAGLVAFNSKDIAVGIANGTDYALSDTNSRLGFEFYKSQVNFGSIDINDPGTGYTYNIIYKTTLPQDLVGTIKEIGLYPDGRASQNLFDSKFLSTFENNLEWKDSTGNNPDVIDTVAPRIGNYLLEVKLPSGNTVDSTKEYKTAVGSFDLSGYSVNDSISLAFNIVDTNSAKIRIKFYSSATDYFYADIATSSLSTGNYIKEVSLSSIFDNMSGTPDPTLISHIGIELSRTSNLSQSIVYLDGLRVNDEDTFDPIYGMISRSILTTPIEKIAGRPIDIEYKLTLGF